jgi:hypothetical protein
VASLAITPRPRPQSGLRAGKRTFFYIGAHLPRQIAKYSANWLLLERMIIHGTIARENR